MRNTNWLQGMQCPGCGSYGPYYIDVAALCTVTDDGPVYFDYDNAEWNMESGCICQECHFPGRVSDFQIKVTPHALPEMP